MGKVRRGLTGYRRGDKIGGAPISAAAYAEYHFVLPSGIAPYVRLDDRYVSNGPTPDYGVFRADPTIPGSQHYDSLLARLGAQIGNWNLSVYGNNLLNQAPLINRSRDALGSPLYFDLSLPPRTIGATVIYSY